MVHLPLPSPSGVPRGAPPRTRQGRRGALPSRPGLQAVAARCKENRVLLQGLTQWQRGRTATRPDEVLAPYRAATGLAPEDLPAFFRLPFWTLRYRGERWAAIAEALLELRAALVTGNEPATD